VAKTRFALLPGHDEENVMTTLPDIPLPSSIRSRYVDDINGLRVHVLEAGFETKGRPCVLLLHGFPELAFSWRKVMPVLAAPPDGTRITKAVSARSGCPIWCATRSDWCRRSATARSMP
jgi:hypothetical protein